MNIIEKLCNEYFKDYEYKGDSPEYKEQSLKCDIIYEDLFKELTEEQQKKLLLLEAEDFEARGQWLEDGFNEGAVSGFKLAFKLIIDALK